MVFSPIYYRRCIKNKGRRIEMRTKYHYYKTALWIATGHFVKLVKYHERFHYYEIETIPGEKVKVPVHELKDFVL
jgi:hypothetical protein